MQFRADRIAALMREELSRAILRDLEFPGALVTITGVELTEKRDAATVRVSVFPDERAEAVVARLMKERGPLAYTLLKRMRIRAIPELVFKVDRGPQNAAAVEKATIEHRLSEEESGS